MLIITIIIFDLIVDNRVQPCTKRCFLGIKFIELPITYCKAFHCQIFCIMIVSDLLYHISKNLTVISIKILFKTECFLSVPHIRTHVFLCKNTSKPNCSHIEIALLSTGKHALLNCHFIMYILSYNLSSFYILKFLGGIIDITENTTYAMNCWAKMSLATLRPFRAF